jgi:hypothetical protein
MCLSADPVVDLIDIDTGEPDELELDELRC